jgi:hypothetical protein
VWQYSSGGITYTYILKNDGTGFYFFHGSVEGISWYSITWSTSQIDGDSASFSGTSVTIEGQATYTKNTATKTPAKADDLVGVWANSGHTIEFKADSSVKVVNDNRETILLKYCVEGGALYLLYPPANTVILSIPISDGAPQGLTKTTSDSALAGIWKTTEEEQNYYYTLDADGKGTFTTLGVSIPVSLVLTAGKIDSESYTITEDTLTFTSGDGGVTYTKVASIPPESGADGDTRLHGTWNANMEGVEMAMTFDSDGTARRAYNGSEMDGIWKADGSTIRLYTPRFPEKVSSSPMSYTVSGSTLTIGEIVLTK